MTRLTALQLLDDRAHVATVSCERARADRKEAGKPERNDWESYRNGQACAYIDARRIMDEELRRLCNRFQNGCLSVDDFGVVL